MELSPSGSDQSELTKQVPVNPAPMPTHTRRFVLQGLGAAVAALMAGCRDGGEDRKSPTILEPTPIPSPTPSGRMHAVEEVEPFKNPPKIDFKGLGKPEWNAEPESGMPEMTAEHVVALGTQIADEFELYLRTIEHLTKDQQALSLRKDLFAIIINGFLKFNPNFSTFFENKRDFFSSDNYALIDLANRALIAAGFYLYANFRENEYEIYKVKEYGTFESDTGKGGGYVLLGDGKHSTEEKGMAGTILADNPDMVHVWPHVIANYRYDGRVLADEEEGFSEMTTRGYLRHEATHSVLYRSLPKLRAGAHGFSYNYPVDLDRRVSINFGQFGPTNSRSLHEMAAIGAQLAQCEHPLEIFTFLGNTDDPDYQFARLCLTMILIKNLPQDSSLRDDCLRGFETGALLDMVGIFDYVEQTRDLRLVQGVGLEMYNVALQLIERWPRA